MEQVLSQKQKQQLVITNNMEQQLSLLHMPLIDLEGYLMEQALENPLIDIESFSNSTISSNKNRKNDQEWLNNIEQPRNLYDYLLEQLIFLKLQPQEQEIVEYLIFLVDENGYFQGDLQEVSKRFAVSYESAEQALHRLQSFEPIGIGARNLQECMLLQAREMEYRNEFAEMLISDYFELLVDRKWKEISNQIGAYITEVQFVYDLLKSFNPRPGSPFQNEYPQNIQPEIIISGGLTGYKVMINDALYPKLQIDSYYNNQIDSLLSYERPNYLKEKHQQISWLQQSLNKRKRTLVNVMQAILDKQSDFFQKGKYHLKPLTIKEIAETVGLHESTVSRAVNGKYVLTPHGLFELRDFFTTSKITNESEETSSEIVKQSILKLVENENRNKPLSDQKIVELLKENEGLHLSRRTVAKYREQLGILASSKRKRY